MTTSESPSVDDLVARLRARVEERRRSGAYPPGLEAELDRHFHHIAVRGVRDRLQRLREALAAAAESGRRLSAERIALDSERPGGAAVHRAVSRLVGRQVEGVLTQVREYADTLSEAHRALVLAYTDLVSHVDELRDRFTTADGLPDDLARVIADLEVRVDALEVEDARRRRAGRSISVTGAVDTGRLAERAAAHLGGRGSVLVAGPPHLASALDGAGVSARVVDDPLAELADADPGSLDGAVLTGIFEFLAVGEQFELAARLAIAVVAGGTVVVGASNPHALAGPDPEAAAPAHPAYLSFLLREAGFDSVEVEWDGDVERGADPETTTEHLARAVFGAAAFTLVARR